MFKLPIDKTKCYLPMHSDNCRSSCLDNPCRFIDKCAHFEEFSQVCQHEFRSFDCEHWKRFVQFRSIMAATEFWDMQKEKTEEYEI